MKHSLFLTAVAHLNYWDTRHGFGKDHLFQFQMAAQTKGKFERDKFQEWKTWLYVFLVTPLTRILLQPTLFPSLETCILPLEAQEHTLLLSTTVYKPDFSLGRVGFGVWFFLIGNFFNKARFEWLILKLILLHLGCVTLCQWITHNGNETKLQQDSSWGSPSFWLEDTAYRWLNSK